MTPDERLALAVHDLDAAPDDLDVAALADQLQIHGRLAALGERDLAGAVVAELRYEDDAPRFAAEVVDRLKTRRLPRVASLAAAALFLALTGWVLFRDSAAPAAGKRALIVVGRLPLEEGDRAVADRLERLGFRVQAATPDAFDPSGRALVAVSSTVLAETMRDHSDRLRSGLRGLAVPVIVWEPRLFHELGLIEGSVHASDWAADPQTALSIDAPGHPLAAGLSGVVEVTRSRGELTWGRVGPAALRIASLPGRPDRTAIFGYERGTAAPARRVGLFLFDQTGAALTDAGGRLVDAAVLWCTEN